MIPGRRELAFTRAEVDTIGPAGTMAEADAPLRDDRGHYTTIGRRYPDSLFRWRVRCTCGGTWTVDGVRRRAEDSAIKHRRNT